jgi:hypothetical protein
MDVERTPPRKVPPIEAKRPMVPCATPMSTGS